MYYSFYDMANMFKKPKRNFRTKRHSSESDDDAQADNANRKPDDIKTSPATGDGVSGITGTATSNTSNQNKKGLVKTDQLIKVSSTNSMLSFADEEGEEEVFQVKKSVHSKRLVHKLKRKSQQEKQKTPSHQPTKSEQRSNGNHSPVIRHLSTEESSEDENQKRATVHYILKSGQIPDAKLIHLARKHRQQAQEQGDGFIPLDDTTRVKGKTSRLIRDDDNDRSDDDYEEELLLTHVQKDEARRRLEHTILAAEESEASEPEREWEEQQIKKGVNIPAQQSSSSATDYYNNDYAQYFYQQPSPYSSYPVTGYGLESTLTQNALPPINKTGQPETAESLKQTLVDRLTEMTNIHRVHVHECTEMNSRAEASDMSINDLGANKKKLEEQYMFFQEMRGYVTDLVECMNEKMSSILYLDRCMMELLKQRADRLLRRRQDDVRDQSLEYMASKSATTAEGPEEVARRRRKAEREGRRSRRKRERESRGVRDHNEGLSTDDEESLSEMNKMKSERDRLASDASSMFNDVIDDYWNYNLIRRRFDQWKKQYADTYKEAYIALCLPKLLLPLIKFELIMWQPLEGGCVDFEQTRWYRELVLFGGHSIIMETRLDDDYKLIPGVIEKVLVPKLTALIELVWDPLSLAQSLRLVKLVRRLANDYPTVNVESKSTEALFKTVIERIRKCLNDDIFLPLYPKQVLENRASDSTVFFHRQFWTCIKLLSSIMQWAGLLSRKILVDLAVDSLLNRYIMLALQSSTLDTENLLKCQAIASAFSTEWLQEVAPHNTLPEFETFARYLVSAAETLHKDAVANAELRTEYRGHLKQITRILIHIQANNQAATVADKYYGRL